MEFVVYSKNMRKKIAKIDFHNFFNEKTQVEKTIKRLQFLEIKSENV